MDNRIKGILFALVALILAGFMATQIGKGNGQMVMLLCVLVLAVGSVLFFSGRAPFDGAVLLIVVAAIWLTGKGFVYLNVGGLLYVSEVILACLLLGYVGRVALKKWPIVPSTPFGLPFLFLILYGLLHVYLDIRTYGFMTLRDAAVVYYVGFFIAGYQLASDEHYRALALKVFLAAAIPTVIIATIIRLKAGLITSWSNSLMLQGRPLFAPHMDASDAVVLGLCAYCVFMSVRSQKAAYIYYLGAVSLFLFAFSYGRGVVYVACIILMGLLLLAGRVRFLVSLAVISFLLLCVVTAVGFYYEDQVPRQVQEMVHEVKAIGRKLGLEIPGEKAKADATISWRLAWWSWITKKVMAEAPLYGLKLGADLHIEFHEMFFRKPGIMGEQSTVRGAHSSMFTIFGRLGLIGLGLFLWISVLQISYMIKGALLWRIMGNTLPREIPLYLGIVCGTMGSTFFQYGWEAPYSALPMWTIWGLLAYLIDREWAKLRSDQVPYVNRGKFRNAQTETNLVPVGRQAL